MGYILILVRKTTARFYSLAVHPDYQCRGIAKSLIKQALFKLVKLNIKTVKLEFRQSNIRLKKLYESFGFQQIAVLENYYGNVDPAISMCLVLSKKEAITPEYIN